ncbi:hypothetical protein BC830DRAFT_1231283 [Chytriomyces sp. MP71]|nr:hypothetical protein BC830DRAFT_1231283 [Chytriomyces sp. MP71]
MDPERHGAVRLARLFGCCELAELPEQMLSFASAGSRTSTLNSSTELPDTEGVELPGTPIMKRRRTERTMAAAKQAEADLDLEGVLAQEIAGALETGSRSVSENGRVFGEWATGGLHKV